MDLYANMNIQYNMCVFVVVTSICAYSLRFSVNFLTFPLTFSPFWCAVLNFPLDHAASAHNIHLIYCVHMNACRICRNILNCTVYMNACAHTTHHHIILKIGAMFMHPVICVNERVHLKWLRNIKTDKRNTEWKSMIRIAILWTKARWLYEYCLYHGTHSLSHKIYGCLSLSNIKLRCNCKSNRTEYNWDGNYEELKQSVVAISIKKDKRSFWNCSSIFSCSIKFVMASQ